ncbi:sugar transporter-like protein [Microdochium trichocladiopsis]|uniref:Sugar transporter-like protein n=1 Tax=Microdochium trichocladiopsis TaxID=1682393 RepID=A0A9P8YJW3_9PEZI|nr:sugar transporter-like protein [Microdochium trichocladiopsis]KAH7040375.1 sugar transporter-like protein [Microdochium trichocladiopsis]
MADRHNLSTAQKVADTVLEEKLGHSALYEAKQATDDEHAQTFLQALRENRKAALWSIAISMAIIMEGYDTILIGNFMAYPEFQQKFGQYYPGLNRWEVPASWQSGLNMGSTVGAIFGGLINGYLISRFGYRWVLIGAMGCLNAFIFVVFFAKDNAMLLGGQILCGLSWGVFATLCPSYASEVCPTNLRGYLTTYVNLCWAIGQLLATGVLRGCLSIPGEMGYKVPFAIQWLWPLPLMIVAYLAPESPWYLVRVDRIEDARRSIARLSGDKTQEQMNNQLAMMMHTVKLESEATKGGSYLDCFKGTNLRRTEIVCFTFMGQILSGSSFAYTPTYFFTSAGMPTVRAFDLSLGAKGMAFLGTCLSWFLITYFGRRTIYVSGMGVLALLLFLVGVLNVSAGQNALWPSGGLCVAWLFVYSLTIGPLAYSITSETSSVRLRPLSVVLARVAYQLINIVSQVLSPYMVNPTAWNWSGKTGFFWAGTAACMFVWAYFRLPEIKGRTYEELDILFENRVPARKFASTHVDAYASSAALAPGVGERDVHTATYKE